MNVPAQPVTIALDPGRSVSGLLQVPPGARACYVFAHGAGAGMTHPFMAALAAALATRDVATLRYQFHYMERGSRRPDPPALAHAAVRAAVAEAARRLPDSPRGAEHGAAASGGLPLFAGGKSFGGRMTSQAQAAAPLPGVRGLVFVGFPLHPAGKPSRERAQHLAQVDVPMLFLQGTRDELADLGLVREVCAGLGARATLEVLADADHSFHVPARSGGDAAALERLADAIRTWIDHCCGKRP